MRRPQKNKKKLRVAVISGGFSSEREISLKSGAQIARSLSPQRYRAAHIEIAGNGRWLLHGEGAKQNPKALTVLNTARTIARHDLKMFDAVLLALHGAFGEDGKMQAILETLGIPYTGSGVMASAIGMNKAKASELAALAGIPVPKFFVVSGAFQSKKRTLPPSVALADPRQTRKNIEQRVWREIGYPCVVKPNESGSSVGVSIVRTQKDLAPAITKARVEGGVVMIQKYVAGRELTCGVLGNSGQTALLALPPVLIVAPKNRFFDYEAKYFSKETRELCPAPVHAAVIKKAQAFSKKAHELFECDGLTRSDFILDRRGKLWFLEINTIPGMTEASLCPKEARALGWSFEKFLDKIIELALLRHRKK